MQLDPAYDELLVLRSQDGDRGALDELVNRWQGRLFRHACRLTANPDSARDAVQEAWIAIVRGLPRFDGRAKFSTWAYRVATNACLDELRRRNRRPDPGLPEVETPGLSPVGGSSPRDPAETVSAAIDVDRGLSLIPDEFRTAVVLRDVAGLLLDDARRLGAHEVVNSRNADEMAAHMGTFDFILDTVSADHDVNAYIQLLGLDGNLTLVGAPEKPLPVSSFALLFGRKSLSGSLIGGIAETQEMLDFCGEHGITADVEVIPIQQINEAYERMLKRDVKYRFVIDMASLRTGER